uniref:Slc25a-16 n=1 Tax=Schmidtea mediterranea TaxID=79327 RepID=A0A0H3YJC4_SCHMD|nr:slc25a-16 [Schmidtea mediterranea]
MFETVNLSNSQHSQIDYAIAGASGGFVSRAVVQPLDVVKIRFQLQVEPIQTITDGKYKGIAQAIKCIYKEEGLKAFWKGHLSSQIQAVSFSLVQFSTYELCKVYFWPLISESPSTGKSVLKSSKTFLLGSLAGSTATIFTQPFDVFRTRFAAQGEPKTYPNLSNAIIMIIKTEGLRGLFRGLIPSLLLVAPQTGFQFFFYNLSNNVLTKFFKTKGKQDNLFGIHKIGILQSALSGGIAGSMAKICVYPVDIIKKRMQVQGFEKARSKFGKLHVSKGVVKCIKVIFLVEGIGGYFKGLKTSVIKSFISLGLRFSVYEQVCNGILNLRDKIS